jgi:hypothetical protein
MKRLSVLAAILFLAPLLLASCSKNDTPAGSTSVLDGTWATACTTTSGIPGATNWKLTATFANGVETVVGVYYSDTSCTTAIFQTSEVAAFTVGAAESTPAGSTDLSLVTAAYTGNALTSAEVTAMSGGCTKNSAAVVFIQATPIDLAGANCGGLLPANGTTLLNVFKIDGTTLKMGSGTTSDLGDTTRPTSFAFTLTKQ